MRPLKPHRGRHTKLLIDVKIVNWQLRDETSEIYWETRNHLGNLRRINNKRLANKTLGEILSISEIRKIARGAAVSRPSKFSKNYQPKSSNQTFLFCSVSNMSFLSLPQKEGEWTDKKKTYFAYQQLTLEHTYTCVYLMQLTYFIHLY